MSNNLLDVIKEIFSTYNYAISTENKDFDFIAEKPNNNIAIRLIDSPDADDVKQFADVAAAANAKGLIASMAFFADEIKKIAKQKDVMVWDRPELEKQIGKAVLMRLDSTRDPFAAAEPAAKKDVAALTQELYGAPEKARTKPVAPKVAKAEPKPEPEQKPEILEAEEAPAPAEAPEAIKLPISSIPIKIKNTDAIKLAGAIGKAEDTEVSLNFIPFWKYDFSLDVTARYRDMTVPLSGKGSRMINAITRAVEVVPAAKPLDGIEIPDTPYNVQQAVVTEEEARNMAVKTIIEEHSKTVRFKGTQGEAAIVEHKKFSPKVTDVRFNMEMMYMPFWAVRSHKGYVEINAFDGKPTKAPMDDGAEIL